MTTELAIRRAGHAGPWVPAALLLLSCASEPSTRRGDRVIVSSYPPEIQAAYRVFAVRCSRCHTLARPLNARITDPEHWVRYVTRMRRQPTSGINRDNADIILRFLVFYANERKRAEEAADHPVESATPPVKAAAPVASVPAPVVPEPAADNPSTPASEEDGRSR